MRQRHPDLLALPPGRGAQPHRRVARTATDHAWWRSGPSGSPRRTAAPLPRGQRLPGLRLHGASLHHLGARRPPRPSRRALHGDDNPRPTSASTTASSGCVPVRACWATPAPTARVAPTRKRGAPRATWSRSSATGFCSRAADPEVINVGGVKVHPLPVEQRILALPDVEAAARLRPAQQAHGRHRRGRHRAVRRCGAANLAEVRQSVDRGGGQNLPRACQPRTSPWSMPSRPVAERPSEGRRHDRSRGRTRNRGGSPRRVDHGRQSWSGRRVGPGIPSTPATASKPAPGPARRRSGPGGGPEYKERFHFTLCDLSDAGQADQFVKDAAQRWGSLDGLINNAGVAREG